MILKPQDVLVVLKLVALAGADWSYAELAVALGMSPSQLHSAVKRAQQARLVIARDQHFRVHTQNLAEFLIHGLKYVFVPEMGGVSRGVPTRYAAPPLGEHFVGDTDPPPVWPDPAGDVRGQAFEPIYKLAPTAARRDAALYELLVLIDAIRGGQARERTLAIKELEKALKRYDHVTKS